jgi:hypothetical protein
MRGNGLNIEIEPKFTNKKITTPLNTFSSVVTQSYDTQVETVIPVTQVETVIPVFQVETVIPVTQVETVIPVTQVETSQSLAQDVKPLNKSIRNIQKRKYIQRMEVMSSIDDKPEWYRYKL